MSLESQGSSLGELYPDMISQMGKSWQRQYISDAAESVLRRYRKWRKSNRMQHMNSFHAGPNPKNGKEIRRDFVNKRHHNHKSPGKSLASRMVKTGSPSPVKVVKVGQTLQGYLSPVRRREAPATVLVMDMSTHERELNKTFIVDEPSLNYSMYKSSPSRSSHHSNELSFMNVSSHLSPRRMQPPGCSKHSSVPKVMYASPVRQSPYQSRMATGNGFREQSYGSPVRQSPNQSRMATGNSFREQSYGSPVRQSPNQSRMATGNSFREQSYGSPVRQSPYQSRMATGNGFREQSYGSPVRQSPNQSRMATGNGFREQSYGSPVRQSPNQSRMTTGNSYSEQAYLSIMGSPRQSPSTHTARPKMTVPRRTLEYSDLLLSPQLSSTQMGRPWRQKQGLRRNLSFDASSLTSSRVSSPFPNKDSDSDFRKLYHKLVCLKQSSLVHGQPCKFCAKNSQSTRGHSWANLAALALSPHRPLLRKRHPELDIYPQSKRLKESFNSCS
ncbi:hypothetical protein WMY93_025153 [Mugilogobius chulae]|uniref:Uncharacterized protein n=1 Tax=Mugilogobius chulae TaxID=88201 RepID=A0AAW0N3B0_9GOBI